MMAQQLDTYLVEKLREILQRLYSTKKLNGLEVKESHTNLEEDEQVAYKRSPILFPYAPTEENLANVGRNEPVESSAFAVEETEINERYFEDFANVSYYTPIPNIGEDNISTSDYSNQIAYGVEVNCTTVNVNDSSANESYFGVNKVSDEDESSALTRNLHEFIHILKMSLKSGTSGFKSDGHGAFYGGHKELSSGESYNSHGESIIGGTSAPTVHTGSTDPFSGIETASNTDMEFNLTLDDILDLNNLLQDGDETTSGVPLKHIFIIILYSLIACVSIIGNLLVVQLVIRSRRFHTLTHALLANLAAADLFLATFNIPFSAARVIMSEWPFGSFLCRTVPFVQVTSVYATSFTMAVIAVDRYQVIMNPLGKRLKCSQGILLVIAIWILSGILSLPYALNHKVVTVLTVRIVKRCQAEFGSLRSRQLLTVATFLAQYLLPLLFTTVSYISIMRRLWHRSSGLGSTTPRQIAAQSRAKRKTIKMLVLTVICFAISWAPINIYHLLTHFSHVRHNSTAILICHMIAMSSSMYNPFIFCGLNEHFRREAVKWLHCFRTRRSPTVHPGTEINGMLARADQICRRNLSTTVVHTTLSSRRSPQQQITASPRSCQRRRLLAASSINSPNTTFAAVYMTPRHHANSHPRSSPIVGDILTHHNHDSSSCRNGADSPAVYQPELLFLVKETTSPSVHKSFDPEEIESVDDEIIVGGKDFLDSFCEDWNSSESRAKCRTINQSPRQASEFLSLEESFSAENNDDAKEETQFMGELENEK